MLRPETVWLLGMFHENRMGIKAGGSMFGSDSRYWPAWWADAVEVLSFEHDQANKIQGIKE